MPWLWQSGVEHPLEPRKRGEVVIGGVGGRWLLEGVDADGAGGHADADETVGAGVGATGFDAGGGGGLKIRRCPHPGEGVGTLHRLEQFP